MGKTEFTKEEIQLIVNALRQATIIWDGRKECFDRAAKYVEEGTYKNGKPKIKTYWQCAKCSKWYRDSKSLEVDHIAEVGPYTGNLHEFALRLFCGPENLQLLCVVCHQSKTTANASLRYERKVKSLGEPLPET